MPQLLVDKSTMKHILPPILSSANKINDLSSDE